MYEYLLDAYCLQLYDRLYIVQYLHFLNRDFHFYSYYVCNR